MKLTCRCGFVHDRGNPKGTHVVTAAENVGRIAEIERSVEQVDEEKRRELVAEANQLTSLLLVCPECKNLMWCKPDGSCTVYRYMGDHS